jgi:hypothetical protein
MRSSPRIARRNRHNATRRNNRDAETTAPRAVNSLRARLHAMPSQHASPHARPHRHIVPFHPNISQQADCPGRVGSPATEIPEKQSGDLAIARLLPADT